MNNNPQRVAVSVKDSTAKLIMGLLVDVGLPFEYRKAPGLTMSAVVSVAERNGPTLLKVRDVVEDRQGRAQVRSIRNVGFDLPTDATASREAHPPKMPPGYKLVPIASGFEWWKGDYYGPAYSNKEAAASAAWTHHFKNTAQQK